MGYPTCQVFGEPALNPAECAAVVVYVDSLCYVRETPITIASVYYSVRWLMEERSGEL